MLNNKKACFCKLSPHCGSQWRRVE